MGFSQVNPVYLVLGMHRSGTSAATQLLALAGCGLPENLVTADEHNARGYFEPWRVAVLNDERLRAAASLVEAQVPSADPVLVATAAVLAGDPVSARRLRQALPADLVNEQVLTLDALLAAATPPSAPGRKVP